MYCVDYQMSYPLLVVPYAPLKERINMKKAFDYQYNQRLFFMQYGTLKLNYP